MKWNSFPLTDVHAIANDVVTLGVPAVQLTKSNWPGLSSEFVVDTKQNINYLKLREQFNLLWFHVFVGAKNT